TDREYEERFAELFGETMRLHVNSDVPVGTYLSGGLDSSLVTAETRRLTGPNVDTFSIGFEWEGDEIGQARDVAAWLDLEHHALLCKPPDLEWLPCIVWPLDEPFGDPIVLPTFLLSKSAHQSVKVILSGEGADEMLGGYLFHRLLDLTHRLRRVLPAA